LKFSIEEQGIFTTPCCSKNSSIFSRFFLKGYFYPSFEKTMLGQGILKHTAFTHSAWFPDIEWNAPHPPEISSNSFLLDSRHLEKSEVGSTTLPES